MSKYIVVFQRLADNKRVAFVMNEPNQFSAMRNAWTLLETHDVHPKESYFMYSITEVSPILRKEELDSLIEAQTRD